MWDMNPEVSYFANHASNRLEMISPLVEAFDQIHNSSSGWTHQYGGSTPGGVTLLWILKSVWKYTQYTGDETRERGTLYRLLKLGLTQFMTEQPSGPTLIEKDGYLNVVGVTSPEYPAPWNRNCSVHAVTANCTNTNFGIALIKWGVSTLLTIIEKHQIDDPSIARLKEISARLHPLSSDETGYMVDWKHALDMPHRHWSHLLAIYDLAIVPLDGLAERSVDHWAGLTCNDTIPCPTHCRGFTRGITGILR